MQTYTLDDIRACNPCIDPAALAPADWKGTLADVLSEASVAPYFRVWTVMKLMPERQALTVACAVVRQIAPLLVYQPSVAMLAAAERYDKTEMDNLSAAAQAAGRITDVLHYWRSYAASAAYALSYSPADAVDWANHARSIYHGTTDRHPYQEEQMILLKDLLRGLDA